MTLTTSKMRKICLVPCASKGLRTTMTDATYCYRNYAKPRYSNESGEDAIFEAQEEDGFTLGAEPAYWSYPIQHEQYYDLDEHFQMNSAWSMLDDDQEDYEDGFNDLDDNKWSFPSFGRGRRPSRPTRPTRPT